MNIRDNGMRKAECGMRNADFGMGNAEVGIWDLFDFGFWISDCGFLKGWNPI
jgi:hypothetical protein